MKLSPIDELALRQRQTDAYLAWVVGLAKGDQVAWTSRPPQGRVAVLTEVDRVTTTQVVLTDGTRFTRTGKHAGRRWTTGGDSAWLRHPDHHEVIIGLINGTARTLVNTVTDVLTEWRRGKGHQDPQALAEEIREAGAWAAAEITEYRRRLDEQHAKRKQEEGT